MDNKIFKILLVGKPESAKNEILMNYSYDLANAGTKLVIGVDFAVNYLETPNWGYITLQLWDIWTDDRWFNLLFNWSEGALGVLLFFSQSDIDILKTLEKWIPEIQRRTQNISMMLVEVISDQQTALGIPNDEIKMFMEIYSIDDIIKVNINSEKSFNSMFRTIIKLIIES